jgi:hypothetical protein
MLTDEQKSDLATVMLATMQIQSAIHTLDNISGAGNKYKQMKKKKYNDFIATVKSFLNSEGIELYDLTAILPTQTQNYLDCVNAFDKVAKEMQIVIAD